MLDVTEYARHNQFMIYGKSYQTSSECPACDSTKWNSCQACERCADTVCDRCSGHAVGQKLWCARCIEAMKQDGDLDSLAVVLTFHESTIRLGARIEVTDNGLVGAERFAVRLLVDGEVVDQVPYSNEVQALAGFERRVEEHYQPQQQAALGFGAAA